MALNQNDLTYKLVIKPADAKAIEDSFKNVAKNARGAQREADEALKAIGDAAKREAGRVKKEFGELKGLFKDLVRVLRNPFSAIGILFERIFDQIAGRMANLAAKAAASSEFAKRFKFGGVSPQPPSVRRMPTVPAGMGLPAPGRPLSQSVPMPGGPKLPSGSYPVATYNSSQVAARTIGTGPSNSVGALTGGGGGIGGAVGAAGAAGGAEGAATGLAGVAAALGPVAIAAIAAAAAVGLAYVALNKLAEVSLAFSSKTNPKVAERYALAVDDAQAVIGRSLIPVTELLTDGVRLLGDAMATVLPSTEEMRTALSPLKDIMGDLRDVFAAMAPLAKLVTSSMLGTVRLFGELARLLVKTSLPLQLLVGLSKLMGAGLQNSVGAANKGISFQGADEYAKSVYQAAYQSSSPGGGNKDLLSYVQQIANDVTRIAAKIGAAGATGQATINVATGNTVGNAGLIYKALTGNPIFGF